MPIKDYNAIDNFYVTVTADSGIKYSGLEANDAGAQATIDATRRSVWLHTLNEEFQDFLQDGESLNPWLFLSDSQGNPHWKMNGALETLLQTSAAEYPDIFTFEDIGIGDEGAQVIWDEDTGKFSAIITYVVQTEAFRGKLAEWSAELNNAANWPEDPPPGWIEQFCPDPTIDCTWPPPTGWNIIIPADDGIPASQAAMTTEAPQSAEIYDGIPLPDDDPAMTPTAMAIRGALANVTTVVEKDDKKIAFVAKTDVLAQLADHVVKAITGTGSGQIPVGTMAKLRSKPKYSGAESKPWTNLPNGTLVKVLNHVPKSRFYKIKVHAGPNDGKIGFIRSAFIKPLWEGTMLPAIVINSSGELRSGIDVSVPSDWKKREPFLPVPIVNSAEPGDSRYEIVIKKDWSKPTGADSQKNAVLNTALEEAVVEGILRTLRYYNKDFKGPSETELDMARHLASRGMADLPLSPDWVPPDASTPDNFSMALAEQGSVLPAGIVLRPNWQLDTRTKQSNLLVLVSMPIAYVDRYPKKLETFEFDKVLEGVEISDFVPLYTSTFSFGQLKENIVSLKKILVHYDKAIKSDSQKRVVTFPRGPLRAPLDLKKESQNLESWKTSFINFLSINDYDYRGEACATPEQTSRPNDPKDDDILEIGWNEGFQILYILFNGQPLHIGIEYFAEKSYLNLRRINSFIHYSLDAPVRDPSGKIIRHDPGLITEFAAESSQKTWTQWVMARVYKNPVIMPSDAKADQNRENDKPPQPAASKEKKPDLLAEKKKASTEAKTSTFFSTDGFIENVEWSARQIKDIEDAYNYIMNKIGIQALVDAAMNCIMKSIPDWEAFFWEIGLGEAFKAYEDVSEVLVPILEEMDDALDCIYPILRKNFVLVYSTPDTYLPETTFDLGDAGELQGALAAVAPPAAAPEEEAADEAGTPDTNKQIIAMRKSKIKVYFPKEEDAKAWGIDYKFKNDKEKVKIWQQILIDAPGNAYTLAGGIGSGEVDGLFYNKTEKATAKYLNDILYADIDEPPEHPANGQAVTQYDFDQAQGGTDPLESDTAPPDPKDPWAILLKKGSKDKKAGLKDEVRTWQKFLTSTGFALLHAQSESYVIPIKNTGIKDEDGTLYFYKDFTPSGDMTSGGTHSGQKTKFPIDGIFGWRTEGATKFWLDFMYEALVTPGIDPDGGDELSLWPPNVGSENVVTNGQYKLAKRFVQETESQIGAFDVNELANPDIANRIRFLGPRPPAGFYCKLGKPGKCDKLYSDLLREGRRLAIIEMSDQGGDIGPIIQKQNELKIKYSDCMKAVADEPVTGEGGTHYSGKDPSSEEAIEERARERVSAKGLCGDEQKNLLAAMQEGKLVRKELTIWAILDKASNGANSHGIRLAELIDKAAETNDDSIVPVEYRNLINLHKTGPNSVKLPLAPGLTPAAIGGDADQWKYPGNLFATKTEREALSAYTSCLDLQITNERGNITISAGAAGAVEEGTTEIYPFPKSLEEAWQLFKQTKTWPSTVSVKDDVTAASFYKHMVALPACQELMAKILEEVVMKHIPVGARAIMDGMMTRIFGADTKAFMTTPRLPQVVDEISQAVQAPWDPERATYKNLEKTFFKVLDDVVKELIKSLVQLINDACADNESDGDGRNYGAISASEIFAGTTQDDINGRFPDLGAIQQQLNSLQDAVNNWNLPLDVTPGGSTTSEFSIDFWKLADDISSILTPMHACSVFNGEASLSMKVIVKDYLEKKYPELMFYFVVDEDLFEFLTLIGQYADPTLCMEINDGKHSKPLLDPTQKVCISDVITLQCVEKAIEAGLTEQEAEDMCKRKANESKDLATKVMNPPTTVIPDLCLQMAKAKTDLPAVNHMLDQVLDGLFTSVSMIFNGDTGYFIPALLDANKVTDINSLESMTKVASTEEDVLDRILAASENEDVPALKQAFGTWDDILSMLGGLFSHMGQSSSELAEMMNPGSQNDDDHAVNLETFKDRMSGKMEEISLGKASGKQYIAHAVKEHLRDPARVFTNLDQSSANFGKVSFMKALKDPNLTGPGETATTAINLIYTQPDIDMLADSYKVNIFESGETIILENSKFVEEEVEIYATKELLENEEALEGAESPQEILFQLYMAKKLDLAEEGFQSPGIKQLYHQIKSDLIQKFRRQISASILFEIDQISKLKITPGVQETKDECGIPLNVFGDVEASNLLNTRGFMSEAKEEYKKLTREQCTDDDNPSENPLQDALKEAILRMLVRVYAIEHVLNSIFVLSSFHAKDCFSDDSLLEYVITAFKREMLDRKLYKITKDIAKGYVAKRMKRGDKVYSGLSSDKITSEPTGIHSGFECLKYIMKEQIDNVSKEFDKIIKSTIDMSLFPDQDKDGFFSATSLPGIMDVFPYDQYYNMMQSARSDLSHHGTFWNWENYDEAWASHFSINDEFNFWYGSGGSQADGQMFWVASHAREYATEVNPDTGVATGWKTFPTPIVALNTRIPSYIAEKLTNETFLPAAIGNVLDEFGGGTGGAGYWQTGRNSRNFRFMQEFPDYKIKHPARQARYSRSLKNLGFSDVAEASNFYGIVPDSVEAIEAETELVFNKAVRLGDTINRHGSFRLERFLAVDDILGSWAAAATSFADTIPTAVRDPYYGSVISQDSHPVALTDLQGNNGFIKRPGTNDFKLPGIIHDMVSHFKDTHDIGPGDEAAVIAPLMAGCATLWNPTHHEAFRGLDGYVNIESYLSFIRGLIGVYMAAHGLVVGDVSYDTDFITEVQNNWQHWADQSSNTSAAWKVDPDPRSWGGFVLDAAPSAYFGTQQGTVVINGEEVQVPNSSMIADCFNITWGEYKKFWQSYCKGDWEEIGQGENLYPPGASAGFEASLKVGISTKQYPGIEPVDAPGGSHVDHSFQQWIDLAAGFGHSSAAEWMDSGDTTGGWSAAGAIWTGKVHHDAARAWAYLAQVKNKFIFHDPGQGPLTAAHYSGYIYTEGSTWGGEDSGFSISIDGNVHPELGGAGLTLWGTATSHGGPGLKWPSIGIQGSYTGEMFYDYGPASTAVNRPNEGFAGLGISPASSLEAAYGSGVTATGHKIDYASWLPSIFGLQYYKPPSWVQGMKDWHTQTPGFFNGNHYDGGKWKWEVDFAYGDAAAELNLSSEEYYRTVVAPASSYMHNWDDYHHAMMQGTFDAGSAWGGNGGLAATTPQPHWVHSDVMKVYNLQWSKSYWETFEEWAHALFTHRYGAEGVEVGSPGSIMEAFNSMVVQSQERYTRYMEAARAFLYPIIQHKLDKINPWKSYPSEILDDSTSLTSEHGLAFQIALYEEQADAEMTAALWAESALSAIEGGTATSTQLSVLPPVLRSPLKTLTCYNSLKVGLRIIYIPSKEDLIQNKELKARLNFLAHQEHMSTSKFKQHYKESNFTTSQVNNDDYENENFPTYYYEANDKALAMDPYSTTRLLGGYEDIYMIPLMEISKEISTTDIASDSWQKLAFSTGTSMAEKVDVVDQEILQEMKTSEEYVTLMNYIFTPQRYVSLNSLNIIAAMKEIGPGPQLYKSTKDHLESMLLTALYGMGENYAYKDPLITSLGDVDGMFQDSINPSDSFNPRSMPLGTMILRMFLETPFLILKGLTEAFDPVIGIVKTLMNVIKVVVEALPEKTPVEIVDQQRTIITQTMVGDDPAGVDPQKMKEIEAAIDEKIAELDQGFLDTKNEAREFLLDLNDYFPLLCVAMLPNMLPFGVGFPPPIMLPVFMGGIGIGPPMTPFGAAYLVLQLYKDRQLLYDPARMRKEPELPAVFDELCKEKLQNWQETKALGLIGSGPGETDTDS